MAAQILRRLEDGEVVDTKDRIDTSTQFVPMSERRC